jgi:methane/ammonia monooxygenase subunit B
VPARQSFRDLELGRDYEYKMVLKGRIPGRYHVHPMIAVKGSGPLVGPGKWIEVTGSSADFTAPFTAISGEQIENLETWGVGAAVKWHLLWLLLAVAWILWWVRRPLLIPRYLALKAEREDLLTTNTDLKVGIALLVGTIAITIAGYQWAKSTYPRTVPLQAGTMYAPPLPAQPHMVDIRFKEARYDVPGRSMRMAFTVTNVSDRPLRVGEFATASVRFVNQNLPAARARVDAGYPSEVVARTGLTISDDNEIKPGETRDLRIDATDAAWEIERLTSFLTDVDSKFGGLLFFFDGQGNRFIAEVGGPILPVFKGIQVKQAAAGESGS